MTFEFLGRGVSTRRLTWTLLAVVFVVSGAIALWLLYLSSQPLEPGIDFADFSEDSTATVVFAGVFPPPELDPLDRPLAIDGDAERLFVAESENGQISVRGYDGSLLSTFTVEPAASAQGFFPIDLAVLSDGRLAIVDSSGMRVVVVDPDEPDSAEEFATTAEGALTQPTSIDASGGVVAVSDGADGTIRIFDEQGAFKRTLGGDLEPGLTFVGGLMFDGATLWVSDSNAGRVLGLDVDTGTLVTTVQNRFELPRGLALGLEGRLFIVDTFARLAFEFDPTAQLIVDTVADEHTERFNEGGELRAPESAYWDATGQRLYIVDPSLGRVMVYGVREEATS